MTTIFERETEIGKCRHEADKNDRWRFAEPDYATILVHTCVSINEQRGMVRMEQHCYLRRGGELPDQPWVKPKIVLEPATESPEELLVMGEKLHEQFIDRVQREFPQEYMV